MRDESRNPLPIIGLLLAVLLICGIIPMWPMGTAKENRPFGCDLKNQTAGLEKFGKLWIIYHTSSFKSFPSTWSVKFSSHESTGYKLTVEKENNDLCQAMSEIYESVMLVPMIQKKE